MKLKVSIVDDHPIFREGLKYYLSSILSIKEIRLYPNGEDFIFSAHRGVKVDLVFIDINMPKLDGVETTKLLRQLNSDVKIIAISSIESVGYVEQIIEAGANGYLTKSLAVDEVEKALDTILKGNCYFSSNIIVNLTRSCVQRTFNVKNHVEQISKREMQVLRLICQGSTREQISKVLGVSHRTVDKHRQKLLEKTDSENTVQLLLYSFRNKIITI
ncbi:MAG: response regulator transcription factor [Bacteroidales bacterium]|nr:response regulator transcription factor [Bacteroidales bacterium]